MRPLPSYVLAALVATVVACAPQADPAAEVAAIRAARDRQNQAVAAKDTTTMGALYAEQARLYPPATPAIEGREAIRGVLSAWVGQTNASFTLRTDTIIMARSGDLAVETGTYRYGFDGPRGRIEDAGYTLAVWQKTGGAWEITRIMLKRDESLLAGG